MKILNIAFLTIAITVIIASCKKDEIAPQFIQNYKSSCNSYDIAGQVHNDGLAYMMSFESEWSSVETDEQMTQFILERGSEYAATIGVDPFTYEEAYAIATNANGEDDIQNSEVLTNYEKNLLTGFTSSIQNVNFSDPESLSLFHSNTENLECSAANDQNIDNPALVLGAISVGNRSVEYWAAFQTKSLKPGLAKGPGIDWKKVAIADVEGFVGGGGVTAIATLDYEGVLKAAVDALAASAKEAIDQLFP